jgi:hypothetical protein
MTFGQEPKYKVCSVTHNYLWLSTYPYFDCNKSKDMYTLLDRDLYCNKEKRRGVASPGI